MLFPSPCKWCNITPWDLTWKPHLEKLRAKVHTSKSCEVFLPSSDANGRLLSWELSQASPTWPWAMWKSFTLWIDVWQLNPIIMPFLKPYLPNYAIGEGILRFRIFLEHQRTIGHQTTSHSPGFLMHHHHHHHQGRGQLASPSRRYVDYLLNGEAHRLDLVWEGLSKAGFLLTMDAWVRILGWLRLE